MLPACRSVHLLGFSDLMSALHLLGRGPREVVLFGVQPESTDWGVTLSPTITAVLDHLIEAVLSDITKWLRAQPRS
jgi:hydrogenase maturation protease